MSEMIERVAKVICEYKAKPCPGNACEVCAQKARAAIEAMREPTEAMVVAVTDVALYDDQVAKIYQAMIDNALN